MVRRHSAYRPTLPVVAPTTPLLYESDYKQGTIAVQDFFEQRPFQQLQSTCQTIDRHLQRPLNTSQYEAHLDRII